MIAVWMGLRCDKCYLAGNLSCLTPSKDGMKLVNIDIAYSLLTIKNLWKLFIKNRISISVGLNLEC